MQSVSLLSFRRPFSHAYDRHALRSNKDFDVTEIPLYVDCEQIGRGVRSREQSELLDCR
jgi:hypothetical protein